MTVEPLGSASRQPAERPAVDVVLPVLDEEAILADSVHALCAHLDRDLPYSWRVTIVDNASTDRTWTVAEALAAERPEVEARRLDQRGRGRALRHAWLASPAEVVSYMDIDLSTNLSSFVPLVSPVICGHSDLATGTRLARGAHVERQLKREVLSRGYNGLVHLLFGPGVTDHQCGFKAVRADVAQALVPQVEDEGWFFDTELLLLAQQAGLRVFEVPVDWIEDLDSRVDLTSTVADDLRGLARVRAARWRAAADRARRRPLPQGPASTPGTP